MKECFMSQFVFCFWQTENNCNRIPQTNFGISCWKGGINQNKSKPCRINPIYQSIKKQNLYHGFPLFTLKSVKWVQWIPSASVCQSILGNGTRSPMYIEYFSYRERWAFNQNISGFLRRFVPFADTHKVRYNLTSRVALESGSHPQIEKNAPSMWPVSIAIWILAR